VRYLSDFLIEPSPILFKLYKHNFEKPPDALRSQTKMLLQRGCEKSYKTTSNKKLAIFEYLRDTAIGCLCDSLNTCYQLDNECVKAVCTKLSSRLYIVETTDKQSILISNNAILTLCKIATNLNHIKGIQEGVLQIYHQKLFSPPSLIDKLIIEQFGCMLVSSTSYSVYQDILNTLITITAETILSIYDVNISGSSNDYEQNQSVTNKNTSKINNSSANSRLKYRYVLDEIVHVLQNISANIKGDIEMNEFLLKLLEIFCQTGVKIKEMNDRLIKNSQKVNIVRF
jgi:hypothetical protein